jgi:hypothetical protein
VTTRGTNPNAERCQYPDDDDDEVVRIIKSITAWHNVCNIIMMMMTKTQGEMMGAAIFGVIALGTRSTCYLRNGTS